MKNKTSRSFTLAEVLITLALIGVVAAMSVPGLMSNTNKAELVNKLIKVNATLSQATQMIKTHNGGTLAGAFEGDSGSSANNMRDKYKSKMVGVKVCSAVDNNCWHKDGEWYALHGDPYYSDSYNDAGNLVSNDGALYKFFYTDKDCGHDFSNGSSDSIFKKTCGFVAVDVNGFKNPNKMGVDIFRFWITQQGIFPFGTIGSSSNWTICDLESTNEYNGDGCAAIVIRTKAMDYLKK